MKSAAIFPGQGSAYPGMITCIQEDRIVDNVFGRINAAAGRDILTSILSADAEGLADVRISQLAVFGTSVCYWHLLRTSERFSCLAGHSLGIYAALHASGAVCLEDCVRVILKVQDAIETITGSRTGLMASVMGMRTDEVEKLCRKEGGVHVSNVNSATQIAISGWEENTRAVCAAAQRTGALGTRELPIPFPLHSPLMNGIEDIVRPLIASMKIREPEIPLLSHLDGKPLNAAGIGHVLAGQLARRVLWRDTVRAMKQMGITRFVEVGPSDVLSKLVRWIDRDTESLRAEELAPCQSL